MITRNNYETFLLSYIDGELTADEQKAVEVFVAENADLARELESLQDAVLDADSFEFTSKSSLIKPELISAELQDKLLMKLDNELSLSELTHLDVVMAADEHAANEFGILSKTKLDASEKIVFENKSTLFRHERDNVVIGRFIRWAAAAILLGFGFYFGYQQLNRKEAAPIARIKPGRATENVVSTDPSKSITNTDSGALTAAGVNGREENKNENLNQRTEGKSETAAHERKGSQGSDHVAKNTTDNKADNVLIRRTEEAVPKETVNSNNKPQIALANPEIKKQPAPSPENNNIVPLDVGYAMAASYNAAEDKNENRILYMDEDAVKRSAAGNVFKKMKKFVERTAKIKPGNSLRIGGFEFASK